MSALPDRYDHHAERLELRALEKMVAALCADLDRLTDAARSRGGRGSRESNLQTEAFAERRQQAMNLLEDETPESVEIRITRLEKMVEALACSRDYFRSA